MKCPKCNFEINYESNFCTNCGAKLHTDDNGNASSSNDIGGDDGNRTIDYRFAPSEAPTTYSSENLDRIFSENKFTIGQINKINSFIEKNDDESSIEKLIQEEISNNKHKNELLKTEYKLLLDFSKKIMMDDLNGEGVVFIQDNGSKIVTSTQMRTVEEQVPVVKQKHGALTKGAATLGFGLVGLAGTSGVKTEMETVEKQVPIQVQKTVKDTLNVRLKVRNNRLEIKHKDVKTSCNFSEIDEISLKNKFVYIETSREIITLKQWDNYFADLLTRALSENIYYLKDYKAIKNKYLSKFSNDLNNAWISEILSFKEDDNETSSPKTDNAEISEMDKIELIKKYHSLKESGIITEEEFEKKKQDLLN